MKCIKVKYPTKDAAKTAIKKINKVSTKRSKLKSEYYCYECEAWHITCMTKPQSRAIGRKIIPPPKPVYTPSVELWISKTARQ